MARKTVYRIYFTNQGKAYELYARRVEQADLYGFVAIEGLLFGEMSSLLHNPAEESLKKEFEGVDRFLIPFHQINRIDEVEKEGRGKIMTLSGGAENSSNAVPPPPLGKS
ncbi:MAG: DUF1820 family protein [Desulfuromonadales bacterium]|nr:DUF1820 family protein [Desulfuromonadales bacterium]MBN2792084.1 DUF1820 family protein [Desulfuromonadales bacterium]